MGIGDLPRYRCIKEVHALEIESVQPKERLEGDRVLLNLVGGTRMDYPPEMFARYMPQPGDFLIVYDDGYESVSPRLAFLKGYVRIGQ